MRFRFIEAEKAYYPIRLVTTPGEGVRRARGSSRMRA